MATDFTDCGFGAITPELILRSLIGCITASPMRAFRIETHTNIVTSAVHCANYEDFQINLNRALAMASDDKPTLRVNMITRVADCDTCGSGNTWFDWLNSCFGEDANGLVYFNSYATNALPQ